MNESKRTLDTDQLAHDLNSPLGVLKGVHFSLKGDGADHDSLKLLDQAIQRIEMILQKLKSGRYRD